MQEENYWTRLLRGKVSRRYALKSGVLLGAGIAAGSLAGCGGAGQTPKPGATAESGEQQPKRGGIVRMYTTGDPPHLDPHLDVSYRIMGTVGFAMNRLLRYKTGPDMRPGDYVPVPDLAEKWEQPDETTYVFKLRQGVKWHDIPPVNVVNLQQRMSSGVISDWVLTRRRDTTTCLRKS